MQAQNANYHPIVGTTQQQSFSFWHSAIWRNISAQALPKKVLDLRNTLLVLSTILVAIDCFDVFLLKVWTCQTTSQCCTMEQRFLAAFNYTEFNKMMMNDTYNMQVVAAKKMQLADPNLGPMLTEGNRPPVECSREFSFRYQGIVRDWLALCFLGSITLFLGSLWLCVELLMVAATLTFTVLPWYTPATIFVRYNNGGKIFDTWWYACVTVY